MMLFSVVIKKCLKVLLYLFLVECVFASSSFAETSTNTPKSSATVPEPETQMRVSQCNPVINVQAENKPIFDVLKELADKYGFSIKMLEAENKPISMDKHDELSRIVESITRNMSVVINYKKGNGCERLAAITVLKEGGEGDKVKEYQPFVRVYNVERDETPEQYHKRLDGEEAIKEERVKKAEEKNLKVLNETEPDGEQLKNVFVAKPGWDSKQSEGIEIEDMNQYVDEVVAGKRVPEINKMNLKQKFDYLRIERQKRREKSRFPNAGTDISPE